MSGQSISGFRAECARSLARRPRLAGISTPDRGRFLLRGKAVLNPAPYRGNPSLGCIYEHPSARFRRPRTRAGVEDRGFAAADQAVVRAGQCRHRPGSRMRRARYRRPCGGDRFLQSATRSIWSWSGRRRRSRPGSSTISPAAGIKAFGPSKQAAQLEGSKGFTKDLCSEFGIPTGAYGRFTNADDGAGLCPRAGRADRGQGRRACRRQGRGGGQDACARRKPPSP